MPCRREVSQQPTARTLLLSHQQGILTILILAQHGLATAAEAPVDLSYLSDTVISLRYFEAYGVVKQAIVVVKKRSGAHEKTIANSN